MIIGSPPVMSTLLTSGVLAQVGDELVGLAGRELEVFEPDELRPAEAVRAVGVTGLPLRREEEHRLPVLVLHAGEPGSADARYVQLHLACRMRVHAELDRSRSGAHGLGRCTCAQEGLERVEVFAREHVSLREGQLEHGVVGHPAPVDELLEHVVVDAERQDLGDDTHRVALFGRKPLELWNRVEVLAVVGAELPGSGDLIHGVLLSRAPRAVPDLLTTSARATSTRQASKLRPHSLHVKVIRCSSNDHEHDRHTEARSPRRREAVRHGLWPEAPLPTAPTSIGTSIPGRARPALERGFATRVVLAEPIRRTM
jgi:hypothetical protein